MKTKWLLLIVVAMTAVMLFSFVRYNALQRKMVRYQSNYNILKYEYSNLKKKNSDRELYITQSDLMEMYSQLLLKFKEYGVKEKNISNMINYDYKIRDTVITILNYDTIKERKTFTIDKNCYTVNGTITNDTVIVYTDIKDTIDVILYKKKNKDVSWIKRLFNSRIRYNNHVLIFSRCKNDTIKSNYNIKIIE